MATEPFGEGEDNVAFRSGGMIVRYSKASDPRTRAERVRREAALLAVVAGHSPIPVPRPVGVDLDAGSMTYPALPGTPLLDLPRETRERLAVPVGERLGAFLAALHTIPAGDVAGLADVDDTPADVWLDEAVEHYAHVSSGVPVEHHAAVEAFLETPPPHDDPAPVFTHNDLGIEHVLVDPDTGEITGIIDWSDAAVADPAGDFGLILRDLGPAALDVALRAHGGGVDPERVAYYARCSLLEDLGYGLSFGKAAYVDKSLAALPWLFPG